MATAEIKAVITAEDRASSVVGGFGGSIKNMAAAVAIGQLAVQGLTFAFDRVVDATKASVGAAFDQVRQVQNASFALRAYEHDAEKVNMVLKDLVSFARSDMGVLFKREELFKAASNLRAFGVASDEIVDKVKILARGVSLGMTNFDELSQIIGRVVQKGRLDAQEFDMLAQRGIVLSSSFRGAAVSSEQLFTELQRVLPADLLQGRANTIDGLMIRLESAFRDLGSSILGVDRETSEFIKGGLGDTMIQGLTRFRDLLASPEIKSALTSIGQGLATFAIWAGDQLPKAVAFFQAAWEAARPAFENVWQLIQTQLLPSLQDLWVALKPYAPYLGEAFVFALIALAAALAVVVTELIVAAKVVTAVANTITYLLDRVNELGYKVGTVMAEVIKWFVFAYANNKAMVDGIVTNLRNFVGALVYIGSAIFNAIISPWVTAFSVIASLINGAKSGLNSITGGLVGAISGRAVGGPVSSNTPYIVGERGPELFVPGNSGTIIPNDKMGTSSTSNTTININVGLMTGSAIERRDAAAKMFEDLKDIASQRGQSVGQMIGAS